MKKICEIKGYEDVQNDYYIATCGRAFRNKNNKMKILKSFVNKKGYHQVATYTEKGSDRKRHLPYVHKLVALAFIPNYSEEKNQVDHLSMNKDQNYISNLEWVTNEENMNRSCVLKRKYHQAKLTHEQCNYIRDHYAVTSVDVNDRPRRTNVKELMIMFDVSQKTISNIGNSISHVRKFGQH